MGGISHILSPETWKPSHFKLYTTLEINADLHCALLLITVHTWSKFDLTLLLTA